MYATKDLVRATDLMSAEPVSLTIKEHEDSVEAAQDDIRQKERELEDMKVPENVFSLSSDLERLHLQI